MVSDLGIERLIIQIFSCGGTIDKVYYDAASDFEVGDPQIKTVFTDANVTFEFQIESLMRKDSLDMTDDDRRLVADRVSAYDGSHVLITHGTDTMANTGRAIATKLAHSESKKVVVLTGSMVPARFRVTDAVFNIGCAVGALQSQTPGVYIAMNGCVFDARQVVKNREHRRFEIE